MATPLKTGEWGVHRQLAGTPIEAEEAPDFAYHERVRVSAKGWTSVRLGVRVVTGLPGDALRLNVSSYDERTDEYVLLATTDYLTDGESELVEVYGHRIVAWVAEVSGAPTSAEIIITPQEPM